MASSVLLRVSIVTSVGIADAAINRRGTESNTGPSEQTGLQSLLAGEAMASVSMNYVVNTATGFGTVAF